MGQIMLGFVVRQCTIALGHVPEPAELTEGTPAPNGGTNG